MPQLRAAGRDAAPSTEIWRCQQHSSAPLPTFWASPPCKAAAPSAFPAGNELTALHAGKALTALRPRIRELTLPLLLSQTRSPSVGGRDTRQKDSCWGLTWRVGNNGAQIIYLCFHEMELVHKTKIFSKILTTQS